MNQEILWLLLVLVAIVAIELKRKRVKKQFFYGAITCLTLAVLSLFIAGRKSYWQAACGFFLFLIFGLLFVCIVSAATKSRKKSLFDSKIPSNGISPIRYRWFTRFHTLSQKYPRTIKVLFQLSLGLPASLFVIGITATILGGMSNENHLILAREQVPTEPNSLHVPPRYPGGQGGLTRYAVFGLSIVVGIVTFIVTLIFGLPFFNDSVLIGLSTGFWVGLFVIRASTIQPDLTTRLAVAAICVLCGYLGGNFSLWVRNILRKFRRE